MEFRWNSRICFGSFHRSALLATDVAASIFVPGCVICGRDAYERAVVLWTV